MANITKTYATRDEATNLVATAGKATQTIACDTMDEKTAFIVANTGSSSATVTVVAGDGMRSSIGDLVVEIPATSEYIVGPLDSMRFKNLVNGNITVKVAGGSTIIKPFSL